MDSIYGWVTYASFLMSQTLLYLHNYLVILPGRAIGYFSQLQNFNSSWTKKPSSLVVPGNLYNGLLGNLVNGDILFSTVFSFWTTISIFFLFHSAPCKNPGNPKGGQLIGTNFRHGKVVSFRCPPSRKIRGPRKITCHDGTWSNKKPQCLLPSQVKGKIKSSPDPFLL